MRPLPITKITDFRGHHKYYSWDKMNLESKSKPLTLLLVRIWLGLRSLGTGVQKFSATVSSDSEVMIDGKVNDYGLTSDTPVRVFGIEHYTGIPESLRTSFEEELQMPELLLTLFSGSLGPSFILLGITILFGIFPRISLFLLGLLFAVLTAGLTLLEMDPGIAWLGTHMLLIAYVLFNADKDKFTLYGKRW